MRVRNKAAWWSFSSIHSGVRDDHIFITPAFVQKQEMILSCSQIRDIIHIFITKIDPSFEKIR